MPSRSARVSNAVSASAPGTTSRSRTRSRPTRSGRSRAPEMNRPGRWHAFLCRRPGRPIGRCHRRPDRWTATRGGQLAMYVGILELDVLLGEVDSLKYKRAVIRPIIARLRRLEVAVTEAGDPD